MIQNDVLNTAKLEGLTEGFTEGRAKGLAEGRTEGLAEGRTEGLAEGEMRERIKMAGQALKMGMSVEDIAKLTGLTREEIEKL